MDLYDIMYKYIFIFYFRPELTMIIFIRILLFIVMFTKTIVKFLSFG